MASKTLCATCGVSDPAMTAHCVLPVSLCEFKHRNGTNKQISGADAQDSKTTNQAISPKPQENEVKTAIVAMLLAMVIASPASAGGIKIEKPCGSNCSAPQPQATQPQATVPMVGSVRFRDLNQPANAGKPVMVGASNADYYREQANRPVIVRTQPRVHETTCVTTGSGRTVSTNCTSN
jgi:hypothetical protein